MIRMKKLMELARVEIAAARFWQQMSPNQRKAYIEAHPNSKYAKNPNGAATPSAPSKPRRPKSERRYLTPQMHGKHLLAYLAEKHKFDPARDRGGYTSASTENAKAKREDMHQDLTDAGYRHTGSFDVGGGETTHYYERDAGPYASDKIHLHSYPKNQDRIHFMTHTLANRLD